MDVLGVYADDIVWFFGEGVSYEFVVFPYVWWLFLG